VTAARWALAFSVAGVASLAIAALLRAASRRGVAGVRRRGALVIAGGSLCGWLFLPEVPGRLVVVAAAVLALALFGAAFVDSAPPRGARLGALCAAALAATAAGVRLEWSGVAAFDVAWTIVGIVAVLDANRGLPTNLVQS
jgi:hypothetical protein